MKNLYLFGLVLLLLLSVNSCGKKQTVTKEYAESVKTISDAYADAIKQTSELSGIANDLSDAAALDSSAVSSSSSNADWKKALDDYEQFVDEYVDLMKEYKANPVDLSLAAKYTSMLEKSMTAADSISEMQSDVSGSDLAEFTQRYARIAAKMANAL
jgi:hypothetical protein